MSLKVEFDYATSYEYASSLTVFLNKKSKHDLEKTWYKEVEKVLSSEFFECIDKENLLPFTSYLQLLIYFSPAKGDINAFIKWLEHLTPGQIYELLSSHLGEEIPESFETFRNYYVNLLTSWKNSYQLSADIEELLQEEVVTRRKQSVGKNSLDIIEEVTNGIRLHPDNRIEKVILVPSYHFKPLNRIYILKETIIILYAIEIENSHSGLPGPSLLRKTKALADEKRLLILKLVASKPRTFTEISKATKISKSNLHYHLTLLRTAGLIRINNYMLAQPDLYEVRLDMFVSLKEDLEHYVFK
ncbi:ArsR/SmtB family transcription factor [Anaerobacillus alkaliphilus]|nr:winged helix-turn-helix domain-containing protein [Anaerobacillus alkaliphilus]